MTLPRDALIDWLPEPTSSDCAAIRRLGSGQVYEPPPFRAPRRAQSGAAGERTRQRREPPRQEPDRCHPSTPKKDVKKAWETYADMRGLTKEQIADLQKSYRMHHDWEDGRMLIVDVDVHDAYKHTGGDAMARAGVIVSAAAAVVVPEFENVAEARERGADLSEQAIALGVDIAIETPIGLGQEIEDTVEIAGQAVGQSLWERFKGWLDSLGGSREAKFDDFQELMGESSQEEQD